MVPMPMTRIGAQDPRRLALALAKRPRRLAVDLLAALLIAASLGTGGEMVIGATASVAADDPSASDGGAAPLVPTPVLSIYRQSTYRAMARVPQFTLTQCVGASVQTMVNQVRSRVDRTAARQRSLWLLARRRSLYRGDGGADPFGWASALRMAGAGNYRAIGEPTLAAALWVGAKLMRLTHRPVGALVWNGGHAWSISGFETTADPMATDDFTVTAVYPIDPLFPRYKSRRWPVVAPLARMDLTRLATYLTRYRDPRQDPRIQNLFVVIVPIGPDGIVPTPPTALLAPVPSPPSPTTPPDPSPSPTDDASVASNPTLPATQEAVPPATPEPAAALSAEDISSPTPGPDPTPDPTETPRPLSDDPSPSAP
jgi:hypothetical protein